MKRSRRIQLRGLGGWPLRWLPAVAGCLGMLAQDGTAAQVLPGAAGESVMRWLNGPPIVNAFQREDRRLATYRPENSALLIKGTGYTLVLDPSCPDLVTRLSAGGEKPHDHPGGAAPPPALRLTVDWQGRTYRARPKPVVIVEYDWLRLPVRLIETGTWFQHVQLADIALVDEDGRSLPADSTLDVRAWGDRVIFEWKITPAAPLDGARATIALDSPSVRTRAEAGLGGNVGSEELRAAFHVGGDRLLPGLPGDGSVSVEVAGNAAAEFSEMAGAWEVRLPGTPWPNPAGTAYPEALLDRVTSAKVNIKNPGDKEALVPLRFVHPEHPLTGVVPMILDAGGNQTGIPIQLSKNWHSQEGARLPYDGAWVHGSTVLRVPPRSTTPLEYRMVHARWQGVPMASVAQLCLVGWGGNGHWFQFALGSWGESLCVQPGRMLRRALITDMRPLLVTGINGKPWSWTANVGGADVMKIIGADGQYIPWHTMDSRIVMSGPNLARLIVSEETPDGRLALTTRFDLPRSDDLMRAIVHVTLAVREDVEIERAAFFQLGADYYNINSSDTLAMGSGKELLAEHTPAPSPWTTVVKPVAMEGANPWMTLYGNLPAPGSREGYATRGLILREYHARLAGKESRTPWFAGYSSFAHEIPALAAELTVPPGVTRLLKGDSVEFTAELVVFPPTRDSFFGKDPAMMAALAEGADSWRMTAWEAGHNLPRLTFANGSSISESPLTFSRDGEKPQTFQLQGGMGLVPIMITGLKACDSWRIEEKIGEDWQPLGTRFPEESHPQVSYDLSARTWSAVLSLRSEPSGAGQRTFRIVQQTGH